MRLDGDGAELGHEGIGAGSAALDPLAKVAVTDLENDLVVGLLHQGAEQAALGLQAGGKVDVGLNAMGQMFILGGHGEGDAQSQFGGEDVVVKVDAVRGGGSLEAIGDTHGESSLLI